ncbi:MAG: hypothetical protein OXC31_03565 [Spirochaetaceae bacterium]|nr:hypothetical protein [Spirochaetaceae bacterium]
MGAAMADLSLLSVARFAVYGTLCVVLSDVSNATPTAFMVARLVLAVLLYTTLILPAKAGATLLLVISLAGQDIVSTAGAEEVEYRTAAIWQLSLGPVNPSMVFFGCLMYQLARIRLHRPGRPVGPALVWFLSVPFVSGFLYGGVFSEFGAGAYLTDIRFPLLLIGSILLYGSLLTSDPRWTRKLVAALVGVLLARHFVDLIYLASNYGAEAIAGVSRSSEDSAKGAVNLLILIGLLTLIARGRNRLLAVAMTVLFGALSLGYATRLIWVGLFLGVIIIIVMLRPSRVVLLLTVAPFLIVAAAAVVTILNPGSALVAAVRAGTVTVGRPATSFAVDVEYNVLSRIDPIRYGEAVNVVDSLGRRGAYLWGTGYGGYYEDRAVDFAEPRMGTSFPTFMFQAGRFFNTHEFVTHVLLKHGALGLVLIASVWIAPAVALVRALRRRRELAERRPARLTIIVGALAAYLPTSMLQNYWSGKGLFLSGIVLALCIHLARERGAAIGGPRAERMVLARVG